MKMMKGLVMSLTMTGLLFCIADKPVLANGTSTNVTWNVIGDSLYIDGTGDMADYAEGEAQPWIGYKDEIRHVEIAEGVTSVGDRAFEGYDKIESVSFADSILTIGEYSFSNTGLQEVTIPDTVETVEKGAFYKCYLLYTITFEGSFTEILGGGDTIPQNATICGYYGSYASIYTEDYYRSYDGSVGDGVMVDVAGFQISPRVGGVRTMYSTNITESDVEEVGLLYGLKYNGKNSQENYSYDYTDVEDMRMGSDNRFVRNFPATQKGSTAKIYSNFENTRSYVMTMTFGKDDAQFYSAEYYIRAYVKLKTGRYIYSRVYQYSVYDVADVLYNCHQMNSETDHDYLYNILKTVNPEYKKVDWKWDMSSAFGSYVDDSTLENNYNPYIQVIGFQLSSTVPGVRTIYNINCDEQMIDSVGMIYGLKSEIQNIGADMVTDSTSTAVQIYEATEEGKLDIRDLEGQKYTMTMLYDPESVCSLTKEYYVRAYLKFKDGSYAYSQVFAYSPYTVADELYQSSLLYSYADHNYIYDNILKKVDPDYEAVEYYWEYMITQNTDQFRPNLYSDQI